MLTHRRVSTCVNGLFSPDPYVVASTERATTTASTSNDATQTATTTASEIATAIATHSGTVRKSISAIYSTPYSVKGGGVCIAAKALSTFAMSDLVSEDGDERTAKLCGKDKIYATPRCIFVHDGMAVIMKTYCDSVGFQKKVMKVYSPKMKYGLREKSNSEHLQYTTLCNILFPLALCSKRIQAQPFTLSQSNEL